MDRVQHARCQGRIAGRHVVERPVQFEMRHPRTQLGGDAMQRFILRHDERARIRRGHRTLTPAEVLAVDKARVRANRYAMLRRQGHAFPHRVRIARMACACDVC